MREHSIFSDSTRDQILQAALGVYTKRGHEGFTYAEVAKVTKMSKPNIAYYFPERIDLLLELMGLWAKSGQDFTSEWLLDHIGQPPEVLVATIGEATLAWAKANPQFAQLTPVLVQAAKSEPKIASLQKQVLKKGLERIHSILRQSKKLANKKDSAVQEMAQTIHCLIIGVLFYSLAQDLDLTEMQSKIRLMVSKMLA